MRSEPPGIAYPPSPEKLTRRESQVMDAVMRGARSRELAEWFGVSPNTVKFHLRNIYAKLGVGSRDCAIDTYRLRQPQRMPQAQ